MGFVRARRLGVGVLAAFALAAAATSSASARTVVEIKEAGKSVVTSAHATLTLSLGVTALANTYCKEVDKLKLESNGKSVDKFAVESVVEKHCVEEGADGPFAMGGAPTVVEVTSAGKKKEVKPKVIVKGNITFSFQTPTCTYQLKALSETFPEGPIDAAGNAPGKLVKPKSAVHCAKTEELSWRAVVENGDMTKTLEADLLG